VFAERQPLKGVENYFTDALLYQEINKAPKEPLPDDDDSGNEADSECEGDTPATPACEPIVVYFNDPQYNNPSEDDDEWVHLWSVWKGPSSWSLHPKGVNH